MSSIHRRGNNFRDEIGLLSRRHPLRFVLRVARHPRATGGGVTIFANNVRVGRPHQYVCFCVKSVLHHFAGRVRPFFGEGGEHFFEQVRGRHGGWFVRGRNTSLGSIRVSVDSQVVATQAGDSFRRASPSRPQREEWMAAVFPAFFSFRARRFSSGRIVSNNSSVRYSTVVVTFSTKDLRTGVGTEV